MSRCNTIIAAALAAAALAAPAALAEPADVHAPLVKAGNPSVTTAAERALAQERYYESFGKPTPPTITTRTVAADTGDGIARLLVLSAVFGALIVGLGAGSGLHLLHVRRRYRTRPVT
jgi:hypothetical protein